VPASTPIPIATPTASPDRWLSGIELGNEYWDNTSGQTTVDQLDVTVTATDGTASDSDGALVGIQ
jgi:hypothetical protein